MRTTLAVLVAALVACHASSEPDPVPQALKIPVRGLHTAPNEHGEIPVGGLVQATDVEIENGSAVPRRGQSVAVAQGADAIFPFQDRLLLHQGSSLFYTDVGVTSATQYAGSYAAPIGRKLRAAAANGNAYVATATGLKRLDSAEGTPVDAGIAPGLDVQGFVTGTSGFLADNAAVAYRSVWGIRDANGNLILGAPSGRAVVANTAGGARDVAVSMSIPANLPPGAFGQLYRTAPSVSAETDPGDEMGLVYEGPPPSQAEVTQLARVANVVTATTAADHGFATGQIVRVGPGGAVAAHTVAVGIGSAVSRSTDGGATWSAAGITGLSGWFNAVSGNGATYVAVGMSVAATSPDGLTWTAQTIPAGNYNAIEWTGALFVAIGDGVAATSPDGVTWTSRSVPSSANYYGLSWTGSLLVAVGLNFGSSWGNAIATSPDGATWTARSAPNPSSAAALYAVAASGSMLVAVGVADGLGRPQALSSPDGIAWTARTIPGAAANAYRAVEWNGSMFAAVGDSVAATSPDGVTWTARAIPAADYYGIGLSGITFIAVGTSRAVTSLDGIAWTSRAMTSGSFVAVASGGGADFHAGEKVVTGTPTATTFTYAEPGGSGTIVVAQAATPLTAAIVDQIPSTFAGATLYTSQSQEGILASAYEPPACRDVAEFRGSLLCVHTTNRATLDAYLLAAGAPSGIQPSESVTINGVTYVAGVGESIEQKTFKVFTAGTPARNLADTTASLVRIVNRSQGSSVYARDLSGVNDAPGHIQFTTRSAADSITVAVSRASAFAFTDGMTAGPKTLKNEIRWSPKNKPDSAPLLNTAFVGDKNKEALRVIALRDSAFILKRDGIWRLTGDNASWAIAPFDTTTELVAPESAVVLDNIIFALSTKGVVQISDTGVTIISSPIANLIERFLAEPLLSRVRELATAAAYESEGRYILWLPSTPEATEADVAFVFDHFESLRQGGQVWVARSDGASAAAVNPYDGKLYRATGTALYRERKALDYTDLSDGETPISIALVSGSTVTLASPVEGVVGEGDALEQDGNIAIVLAASGFDLTLDRPWSGTTGPATAHKAIPSVIEFAPAIPAPGAACRWSEATFLFRHLAGGSMTAEFATELTRATGVPLFPFALPADLSGGYASVEFLGSAYGLSEGSLFPINLRTWIPRDQQFAERLSVRFSHAQAFSPMALEGLSLVYAPTTTRLRR